MDNLDKIDDSLQKKDGNRTLILLLVTFGVPAIIAIWLYLKDNIAGRQQDAKEYATKVDSLNAQHQREVKQINAAWTILYNECVDGRLADKNENIRKLEEKDVRYNGAAFNYFDAAKQNKNKTLRNNDKIKVAESVINPTKQ